MGRFKIKLEIETWMIRSLLWGGSVELPMHSITDPPTKGEESDSFNKKVQTESLWHIQQNRTTFKNGTFIKKERAYPSIGEHS